YFGRETGIWIAGRPVILFFAPASSDPADTDVENSNLGPLDFQHLRGYLNDNQWGPPSGASILNPIFLAFNAQDVDELAGSIEGAFPWTNANFTGGVSESPWQWFNTRDSIVNRITPMSYMNGYYYNAMNWHGGPMQYFMGGALRGFDDHKGH